MAAKATLYPIVTRAPKQRIKNVQGFDIKVFEKSYTCKGRSFWDGETLEVRAEHLKKIIEEAYEKGQRDKAVEVRNVLGLK